MGWTESPPPPIFLCCDGNLIDITNKSFKDAQNHPPHRLERHIQFNENTTAPTPSLPIPEHWHSQFYNYPIANTDVDIDIIICLYESQSMPQHQFIRHIFQNIDRVFRPLDPTEGTTLDEPISVKKLVIATAT
jgi:hypothetical protein